MMGIMKLIHGWNVNTAIMLGFLSNFVLLFVILKMKNKQLEKYNQIMIQKIIFDTIFEIVTILIKPVSEFLKKLFFAI